MKIPSWRLWAPAGLAVAAATALVVTLAPGAHAENAAPAAATSNTAGQAVGCPRPTSATPPAGQVDYFLKVDGIPGDSTDAKHPDEIVIDSFLWGINVDHTICAEAERKANLSDIAFVKHIDSSSPKLAQATATGQHLPTAVLTGRKSGEKPQEFLTIELTEVLVSSYSVGSTDGSVPQDSFALNFAQIKYTFVTQKADGTAGTPVTFCFNQNTNKTC